VKPANIILRPDGEPLLADFGLAKHLDSDHAGPTASGQVLGTPAYMSPEQTTGALVDARSDVYSLGVTLYELLTGQVPFTGGSTVELMGQIITKDPDPPSKALGMPLDRDLETICLVCLRKEPPRRYASAAALSEDLVRYLEGQSIQARPTGVLEREWDALRQNRRASPVTVVMTVLLVAVLVWQVRELGFDSGYRLALAKVESRRAAARVEAAETLREYGAPAVQHLFELARIDDDRRVRVTALESLQGLLDEHEASLRWSIPQLLASLDRPGIDDDEQALIRALLRVLAPRTGVTPPPLGCTPTVWRLWWRSAADRLPARTE
jgi:hypothetical protein